MAEVWLTTLARFVLHLYELFGSPLLTLLFQQQTMKIIKQFDLWKNTEKFRTDYRAVFKKEPYVSPSVRLRW